MLRIALTFNLFTNSTQETTTKTNSLTEQKNTHPRKKISKSACYLLCFFIFLQQRIRGISEGKGEGGREGENISPSSPIPSPNSHIKVIDPRFALKTEAQGTRVFFSRVRRDALGQESDAHEKLKSQVPRVRKTL